MAGEIINQMKTKLDFRIFNVLKWWNKRSPN